MKYRYFKCPMLPYMANTNDLIWVEFSMIALIRRKKTFDNVSFEKVCKEKMITMIKTILSYSVSATLNRRSIFRQ